MVPIRAEYNDGTVVISNIRDPRSNEMASYTIVNTWFDGTTMDDGKVDAHGVYTKLKDTGEYVRKNLPNWGENFLEVDSVTQLRSLDPYFRLLILVGYYKGVKLNGYFSKDDTPAPIIYFVSATTSPDDGGSIFSLGYFKLEHKFVGEIYSSYYGDNYNKLIQYVNSNSAVTKLFFDKEIIFSMTSTFAAIVRNNLVIEFNNKLISNTSSGNQFTILRVAGTDITLNNINLTAPNYSERYPLLTILYGKNIKINGGYIGDSIKSVEIAAKGLDDSAQNVDGVFINNLKVNNVVDGIYIGESTNAPRGAINNVVINGCPIIGGKGTTEETGGDGIKTTRFCTNITITHNTIDRFGRDAIDLYASGDKIKVLGNALTNCLVKAIDIKSDTDAYPEDMFGRHGIDILISDNQILYNREGISIDRSLSNVLSYNKQIQIHNNNISYNKDLGVFLCGQYVNIKNNMFVGNGKLTDRVGDYAVIRLGNDQLIRIAKNNDISGNTFINNGRSISDTNYAVRVGAHSIGNTIFDNRVYNEPDLDNAVQTRGVYVNAYTKNKVYNNSIKVIGESYTIIDGADIETANNVSLNVPLVEGDSFLYRAAEAKQINTITLTANEDWAIDADDNYVIAMVRISGSTENTIAFFNQGTHSLLRAVGKVLPLTIPDSIMKENDVLVARVFKTGTPIPTKQINITVSIF
ncbi:right-handed parallel beta-helix repeat-containing protein [Sphingobacterium sp. 1.A.4]|uniref:right-handed parallel beta-helix repeat-containing protein n=1 Tax=Sphingobacterium sp. 1.A.4 TaxID=2044603 RepID=UPI0015D4DC21|nr:right-handed parallel beta-helix repeat-containing protein [Sphingobacterium sp. 1.A.4]